MAFQLLFSRHNLQFKFDARTSRGSLTSHTAYYMKLSETKNPEITGWGEAAPLEGLSVDFRPDFEAKVEAFCQTFNAQKHSVFSDAESWIREQELQELPALKFALETALFDYKNGGRKIIFDTDFTRDEAGIPINGLVWMGDEKFMQQQINQKLEQGYTCLKLKIGGLDFETELKMLASVREMASPEKLQIRLDANGAFSPKEALEKLGRLSEFSIHSLEQPIKPNQYAAMQKICAESPVPIALDEELIGVMEPAAQEKMLDQIRPQFIILKPTLVGGLEASKKWIDLAEKRNIGWWITSALESNIGLNAIAQFTSTFSDLIPQGLGTGQLYHNNIASPLLIEKGYLFYRKNLGWQTEISD
ncbi:o-succinylbenzoate synthase [Adhaeribacter sp. BT258]|uniref:O-succinylbenzoate synthase n=1 Tax=Adhaeribacter terrigena TaxID=2793070 RepID=A0ABS1C7J5_9BACT|nr:o-succinylbenzoate synthase [Adhaeribacter terrigena]MBK0404673.1 o-succinylbenzoate synthase [Adhaeribacter terrigena]